MRQAPAEQVRWCSLGCGREQTVEQLVDGKCRCGQPVVDLGYRYRDSKGVVCYASTFDTLPSEVRRAS